MSWEVLTMDSRTSFFNTTVFTKSMARFWPLWGAYFGIWLIILPVRLLSSRNYGDSPAVVRHLLLSNATAMGVIMALIFGGLAAMAVWSFLYSSRSACGTACLPLRRESLFFSNVAAGLAPLFAANVLIALLSALAAASTLGAAAFGAAAQWCGAASLTVLFFFGFGTLCAQLTGSVIVMPLVYIVLNFTAYIVETMVRSILSTFVYGYGYGVSGGWNLRWLSPVVGYYDGIGATPVYEEIVRGNEKYESIVDYTFYGWGTIAAYAAVGVVFLALALLLLRARRMETAGEVVAVSPLRPVFRWCMALGCGLVLAAIMHGSLPVYSPAGAFIEMLVFMIVGAFIGWFAARMLLLKSFRAFRGGWAGYGLCCAVILALMLGMRFDLFGYERYVPPEDRIGSVWISANGEYVYLKAPENIARAREIHESIIAHKDDYTRDRMPYAWNYGIYCRIGYGLKDGGDVGRIYNLRYDGDDPQGDVVALQELLNVPEAIAYRKRTEFEFTQENVVYGTVESTLTAVEYGYYNSLFSSPGAVATGTADTADKYYRSSVTLSAEEAWELYSTCLVPDFEDGVLGKVWIVQGEDYARSVYDASISIVAERETADGYIGHDYIRTTPTVDSKRTNAWLEAHGITLHLVGETEY